MANFFKPSQKDTGFFAAYEECENRIKKTLEKGDYFAFRKIFNEIAQQKTDVDKFALYHLLIQLHPYQGLSPYTHHDNVIPPNEKQFYDLVDNYKEEMLSKSEEEAEGKIPPKES